MSSRRANFPTLLLEAGEMSRAVSRRLLVDSERGDDQGGSNVVALPASCDRDALKAALDPLLGLRELISTASSAPQLDVFVIADLTQSGTAGAVDEAVARLYELVRSRYGALFRDYADDPVARYRCNAILVLPPPGEAWSEDVDALLGRLEQRHAASTAPPSVSNIFVISETSGRYLLPRSALAGAIATFLELVLYSELGKTEALGRALRRSNDAYGTFVCAEALFDAPAARRRCAAATAIDIMNWLRHTSSKRTEVAERAPEVEDLFEVDRYRELVPLEQGDQALSKVIDSQCPDFGSAFRDVGLLEDPEEILAHYSERWQHEQRSKIESAERELGRFRIDEVIDEVEVNGVALARQERDRIDRFIDRKLTESAEGNVADTALALEHLRKRLEAERQVLRQRATASLARPADPKRLDAAYARFVEAVAEKPDRRRLLLWGVAAWAVVTVTLALLLRKVLPVLGIGPDPAATSSSPSLLVTSLTPPWAWATAALVGGLVVGTLLLLREARIAAAIRDFIGHRDRGGELQQLLESLSRGRDGSLRAYYGSRFRRACDIWVYRTLLTVLQHVEQRLGRLRDVLITLEQQTERAALFLPRSDRTGPRSRGGWQLLQRELLSDECQRELVESRRKPREVADVVKAYCRAYRPFERWTEQLPFADLEAVIDACEKYYPDLASGSVLLDGNLGEAATRELEAFLAELGPRLDVHLDFSGQLFADADDVDRQLAAAVVVGEPIVELVTQLLQQAGAGSWDVVVTREPGNRVRLLKLVTGISRAAIRWHAAPAGGERR